MIKTTNTHKKTQSTKTDNKHLTLFVQIRKYLWNYLKIYNNGHNIIMLLLLLQIMICLMVCKIKTCILNDLRLISAKLEMTIKSAAN